MVGPRALFVLSDILWVALREGHSVWAVDLKTDVARHVAGTGKKGFSGDGGPATEARFNGPKGIALDTSGRWIVVVNTENQVIRRIDLKTGRIDTLAGSGPMGHGYNGDDQSAQKRIGGAARDLRFSRWRGLHRRHRKPPGSPGPFDLDWAVTWHPVRTLDGRFPHDAVNP